MEKQLKIFLATDYSEAVMNAERYAVQFAKNTNASLTILHVYDIPFSFPVDSSEYAKATEELRKHELQRLEQYFDNLLHSLNIKSSELNFECIVLEGSVGKQIRRKAERLHADIIITGTHSANCLHKIFHGSHTWDVIKKSEIPVLAIPEDALLTKIKNIVFATEYREGEIPAINFLVQLAKKFNAQLTILHIINHPLTTEFEKLVAENFKTSIQNKVAYDKLNLRIAHYDDVVEGLNKFCSFIKTDWLVMSHAKSFLLENVFPSIKSITKKMSFYTHIPLLAVPDFYVPETAE